MSRVRHRKDPLTKTNLTPQDFSVFVTEDELNRLMDDDEDDGDVLGKSIYVPQPELQEEEIGDWSEGAPMESFVVDANNEYEHTTVADHFDSSLKVQEANANGNPFDEYLRDAILA